MGQWITLSLPQGPVAAWQALPTTAIRGGMIVVQEIFGATPHIRDMADRYAAAGYVALAPAFFDLVEPGIELPYDAAGLARGREIVGQISFEAALQVVAAAAQAAHSAGAHKVGTVGYCWGGSVALRAAQALGLPGLSYYGGRNTQFLDLPLQAPVQFHFGEQDGSIPLEAVQQQRDTWPDMEIYTYPAGHAFNRDVDPAHYHAASAELAWQRGLDFLARHVG